MWGGEGDWNLLRIWLLVLAARRVGADGWALDRVEGCVASFVEGVWVGARVEEHVARSLQMPAQQGCVLLEESPGRMEAVETCSSEWRSL